MFGGASVLAWEMLGGFRFDKVSECLLMEGMVRNRRWVFYTSLFQRRRVFSARNEEQTWNFKVENTTC